MRNGLIAVAVAAAIIIGIAVASRKQEPASPSTTLQNAATQAEQVSGSVWNQAQDLVPQASRGITDTAQQLEQAAQQSGQAIQQQAQSAAEQAKPSFDQTASELSGALSPSTTPTQPVVPTAEEQPAGQASETSPTSTQ